MDQIALLFREYQLHIAGAHIMILDIAGIGNISMINIDQLEFLHTINQPAGQNGNR